MNVSAELQRRGLVRGDTVRHASGLHALVHDAPPQPVASYYIAIVRDLAALRAKDPAANATPRPTGPADLGLPPIPMRGFLIDEDQA